MCSNKARTAHKWVLLCDLEVQTYCWGDYQMRFPEAISMFFFIRVQTRFSGKQMVMKITTGYPYCLNYSKYCKVYTSSTTGNIKVDMSLGLNIEMHFVTIILRNTVYPKKYAHGFVVLCFVVVMLSYIMNSNEVFIHIHQGCFAGTGAIVRLPQCQWSKPDGYGKISQCITTTKHSKQKPCAYFLGYTVNMKNSRFVVNNPQ